MKLRRLKNHSLISLKSLISLISFSYYLFALRSMLFSLVLLGRNQQLEAVRLFAVVGKHILLARL